MLSQLLQRISWAAPAAIVIACGGSQTPEAAAPTSEAGGDQPTEEAAAADKPFHDMAPGERLKYMKEVVAPEMAKSFQAFNAEHYADFGCVTCHGPGAKDGKFDMPSDALPKLPADPSPVFNEHPEVAKFMAEQVVPQMAKLLQEEPYNPETGKGFGCFECHQKE